MWLAFIILLLSLVGLVFTYFQRKYSYWERCGVPYEPPVFPYGNLKGVGTKWNFRDVHARIYEKFKGKTPIVGVFFIVKEIAMILDLDLVRSILIRDFANFRDRGVFSNARDEPITEHLFSMDGDKWRAMRVKLTSVFTSGKMKYMFPTIVDVADKLVDCCQSMLTTTSEGNDNVLEISEICARFTTDVIGTCAFGLECNSLKDPDAKFRKMGRDITGRRRHSLLVQIFAFCFPELARKLRLKFFPDDLSEFFLDAVRKNVDYRLKNNIKRNDFMDLLIEMKAKDEELLEKKGKKFDLSQGLSIEQMTAQAFVFFIAGFDTSSATISFSLHELALNQEIQDTVREEINMVLNKYDGKLTYEAMKDMPYLDKVLAETLRKYTVLPHLMRVAKEDYPVPNTNYVIKAGKTVMITIPAIHMDPDIYPDPEKFDPTRFDPEEIEKRHPMAYLPFGDGPRNCIGLRFGKMQSKIGLISLLRNFKFTKSSKTIENLGIQKRCFIIKTDHGIYLRVQKI